MVIKKTYIKFLMSLNLIKGFNLSLFFNFLFVFDIIYLSCIRLLFGPEIFQEKITRLKILVKFCCPRKHQKRKKRKRSSRVVTGRVWR